MVADGAQQLARAGAHESVVITGFEDVQQRVYERVGVGFLGVECRHHCVVVVTEQTGEVVVEHDLFERRMVAEHRGQARDEGGDRTEDAVDCRGFEFQRAFAAGIVVAVVTIQAAPRGGPQVAPMIAIDDAIEDVLEFFVVTKLPRPRAISSSSPRRVSTTA